MLKPELDFEDDFDDDFSDLDDDDLDDLDDEDDDDDKTTLLIPQIVNFTKLLMDFIVMIFIFLYH